MPRPIGWGSVTRRSPIIIGLAGGAVALAVALSIEQGIGQRVGHDFHVFWQAGRNFATGGPLYHGYLPGARQFKYPPFAAFLFQPLGLLPLAVAAVLFSLLNLALWAAAVYLTRDIAVRLRGSRLASPLPLVLATVLSAQFFLDNFHHVQMNGAIFVLVLLGIRAHLGERDRAAAAYFVVATAIKLVPIFFVAWLLVRGRRRAVRAIPPLVAACVLVPLLVRGPATGTAELVEYYQTFLAGHQKGDIADYTRGHNIAFLVNRTMLDSGAPNGTPRPWLPAPESSAQRAYQVLGAAVLLAFLATLASLRLRGAPISTFELSVVFLTCLLLSPITFTANLVFLLFVFHTFLSVRVSALPAAGRAAAVVLGAAMATVGLSGRDLVGRTAYLYIKESGLVVLTMLLLFVAGVILATRERPAAGPAIPAS